MTKFLIIRFSSIGDIVLTTPVIRMLKTQIDGAQIHYVTKSQYVPILENNPYIDKIHKLNSGFSHLLFELKQERFDYIIDLHNSIRSFRLKKSLNVKTFTLNKINIRKWLAVNFKINILPEKHIVDRYLQTIERFNINNDRQGLNYFIPDDDEIRITKLPGKFRKGYIAFVIGAKHFTKRMPPDKILSIVSKIKMPVILLGGIEDAENGDYIKDNASDNVYNGCGEFTLNESASIVRQSKLVITHDTGLMHIAAAYRKNIISIWGNTIPDFGMYPYMPDLKSVIIEVKGLKCRPCSKIGFSKCPKKHFRCMLDIDERQILKMIETTAGNNNNIETHEHN